MKCTEKDVSLGFVDIDFGVVHETYDISRTSETHVLMRLKFGMVAVATTGN